VEREAERLFGAEGPGRDRRGTNRPSRPSTSTSRASPRTGACSSYLEFFQVDSRDRFEIWLARLGRYQGMIRERLRAKRLPKTSSTSA